MRAAYLFLKVDDSGQRNVLRHFKGGDPIAFATTIDTPTGVFTVCNLDYDEADRVINLRLSVHGVQLMS